MHSVINQAFKASSGLKLAMGLRGPLWAASAGDERRHCVTERLLCSQRIKAWWKQKLVIIALHSLAALIILTLVLVLYGGKIGSCLRRKLGLRDVFKMAAVASLLCGNVHSAVPTLSLIEGGVLLGAAMKERNENDKSV